MKSMLLALAVCLSSGLYANEIKKPTYTIKWVLAHEPVDLFKEAAEVFSQEMKTRTNGDVVVDVMTLPEYEARFNNSKKISHHEYVKYIMNGKIEMSQTYTTDLGRQSNMMYVLDLPFLFRDHNHAQKVLEGNIGNQLLSSLNKSNLQGLAFTYSGGYRILPSTKKITKLEDFKGLSVRTSASPIAQETFKVLGAKAIPLPLDAIDSAVKNGQINTAESTYARYLSLGQDRVANVMNETNHSLFLTSIIANGNFWRKLPEDYKKIMKEAAFKAARIERDHSVKSGEAVKEACLKKGIEVNTLSNEEQMRFKNAMKPVYNKYSSMFPKDLVTSIENQ